MIGFLLGEAAAAAASEQQMFCGEKQDDPAGHRPPLIHWPTDCPPFGQPPPTLKRIDFSFFSNKIKMNENEIKINEKMKKNEKFSEFFGFLDFSINFSNFPIF